jgi:tRNA-specific 2-thiouridylase
MPAGSLGKTLFPLRTLTKPEIRVKAAELGLPTATKPDSQGICFVGEVGIKAFLEQYIQAEPGDIIGPKGAILGQHDGAIFYTIGQRHGLGIGGGEPYFVTGKDIEKNEVYVTTDSAAFELSGTTFKIIDCTWLAKVPSENTKDDIRIRHRGRLVSCWLEPNKDGYLVTLDSAERAIAPGQSAVLYQGKIVIGGGTISALSPL